jgi:quinol monooxygenase YgiN
MESCAMANKTFTPAELNDGFVVAIEIDAKVGEEQSVADALTALIVPTMAEPGVKLFLPYRSPTDPKAFFVYELYRNEAGWAEHQSTEHFKAFVDTMLPRIARRERVPFVPFAPNK